MLRIESPGVHSKGSRRVVKGQHQITSSGLSSESIVAFVMVELDMMWQCRTLSVTMISCQNMVFSVWLLLLELLYLSHGVCTLSLSTQAALLLSTGTFATQMLIEVVYEAEICAAMWTEYYTENRLDK